MKRLFTSIRLKLTAAILLPLAAAVVLCWAIGASLVTTRVIALAQQTVESDLNSAHQMLTAELDHLGEAVRLAGQSNDIDRLLRHGIDPQLATSLELLARNDHLAFLTVVDRYGNVLYRINNPAPGGRLDRSYPLVTDALAGRERRGLEVLPLAAAAAENPALAAQLPIAIQPTPHGRLFTKKQEERGLFLSAAIPLRGEDGAVRGALWGGVLLNRADTLIDRIAQVLYRSGDQQETIGHATLFLGDVRIATTVPTAEQSRALGTLMSEEVSAAIQRGETWIGRAFVVTGWNLSAYEPLRDVRDEVVGALYVGMPEAPFQRLRTRINLAFAWILVVVVLCGAAVANWLGANLSRPVKLLEQGVRRVAAGEDVPDLEVEGSDEIAALGMEFNLMKHRLSAREEEVRQLNRTLERKVEERTAELATKSDELLAAQAELARSERLAAIGLLASGVAHEINNPLAIIRGNTELLQMARPDGEEELETIQRQVGRIGRIVANLLTFSRGSEMRLTRFSFAALVDSILQQIMHQVPLASYRLSCLHRHPDATVTADEDQLRQVFTNLILNGLQVMPDGGVLTIETGLDASGSHFLVTITDTGPGIPEENREKLFTPFFTTRSGGTGLGLAISYGIVRAHGGEIRVENAPGRGAAFTVVLPLVAPG